MSIQQLSTNAELAQAAYSTLSAGMSTQALLGALQPPGGEFAFTQAEKFAAKYSVVLQYDDSSPEGNNNGLSLTVFKDTQTNQLTLAIRGTTASDPYDAATDLSIAANGAGYDQIAALYSWWQRASASAGTMVAQYVVSTSDPGDPNALQIPGGYLVRKADVAATGELFGANGLATDPDHRLDVTGHSLGGHLAMAFAALFGASTASVTTFNAPGFKDNFYNRGFFGALGGVYQFVPERRVGGVQEVTLVLPGAEYGDSHDGAGENPMGVLACSTAGSLPAECYRNIVRRPPEGPLT